MKKLYALLIVLLAVTIANAQTPVSGGIYSNTTWTAANSPYIITDTVVVFPGVTLTIEPGVVVKFADHKRIELRQARMIALGTITDSIAFTSNSNTPIPGIWNGLYVNNQNTNNVCKFNYCNFYYAYSALMIGDYNYSLNTVKNSKFQKNKSGVGINSENNSNHYPIYNISIDSCLFNSNNCGIGSFDNNPYGNSLTYNYGANSLGNCVFTNNQTGIIIDDINVSNCKFAHNQQGIFLQSNNVIKNCLLDSNSIQGIFILGAYNNISKCTIKNNTIGIIDNSGPYNIAGNKITQNVIENNSIGLKIGTHEDTIYCNKICSNSVYGLQYVGANSAYYFKHNDWCTSDSTLIATMIFDGYDNINSGIVYFMPIDTSSCFLTTGISRNEFYKPTISVFPNPSTGLINISFTETAKDTKVDILNSCGQILLSKEINNITQTTLDLSSQAKGLYFIKMQSGSGVVVRKVVISE